MSDSAYSLEMDKVVSAEEAIDFSAKGMLKDRKGFACADSACRIPLTCVNWRKVEKVQKYFTPSSQTHLHVEACLEITDLQRREGISKEVNAISEMYTSGGRIIIEKSLCGVSLDIMSGDKYIFDSEHKVNRVEKAQKKTNTNRHISSLESLVTVYENKKYNNNLPIVRMNGRDYTLNEIFVSLDDFINEPSKYVDEFHVFYDNMKIWTDVGDRIKFAHYKKGLRPILSNREKCETRFKSSFTKNVDSNKYVLVYFRGFAIESDNKKIITFNNFNDHVYKDICIR